MLRGSMLIDNYKKTVSRHFLPLFAIFIDPIMFIETFNERVQSNVARNIRF